jgi:hypothetical protein
VLFYIRENGISVILFVVTDPKGMFLDLPREDFITKAEGGERTTLMLSKR